MIRLKKIGLAVSAVVVVATASVVSGCATTDSETAGLKKRPPPPPPPGDDLSRQAWTKPSQWEGRPAFMPANE